MWKLHINVSDKVNTSDTFRVCVSNCCFALALYYLCFCFQTQNCVAWVEGYHRHANFEAQGFYKPAQLSLMKWSGTSIWNVWRSSMYKQIWWNLANSISNNNLINCEPFCNFSHVHKSPETNLKTCFESMDIFIQFLHFKK